MLDFFKKIMFEEISILEFEKQVYENSDLESFVGKDIYNELLSFNFKEEDAYNKLKKYLEEKVIPKEKVNYWKTKIFLIKEGWFEARDIDLGRYQFDNSESQRYGEKILKEFGGLYISNNSEKEIEQVKIFFYKFPAMKESRKLGTICFFADIEIEDASLCIDNDGKYYIYYRMLNQMKYLRSNFEDVLEAIFFRYEKGSIVEQNVSY